MDDKLMKIAVPFAKEFLPSSLWLAGIAFVMLTLPFTASAELGGDAATVLADQAHMRAALKITQAEGYTIHEMKTSSGTVVREYVSPVGKVFGVAWQGPFLPDLHQVLGTSFTQFTQAAQAQRAQRKGHAPVVIQQDELVVKSAGHPRNYFGKAYLPGLLPQGVNVEEIQ
jgi:hypothetical protein